MPSKRIHKRQQVKPVSQAKPSLLKKGDLVMVIAGGHKTKRPNKGQTGKILKFTGSLRDRVVVEGVNLMTKHKRQTGPNTTAGIIKFEAPIHVSNVMYYAEAIKKPVKLKFRTLADGKKVRGYIDPQKKEFVQI
jgi:large subunit ribosomal protein L24